MKKKFLLVLPLLFSFLFPSCGESQGGTQFRKVYFDSVNIAYDGTAHILPEVRGDIPEGTEIVYEGRENYTDVGTYVATATLSKENYQTKVLEATLSIIPAEFSGISYDSITVTFDEQDHFNDIQLQGELPAGTTATQTVIDGEGNVVTEGEAIDPGLYHYSTVLTNKNYKTIYLNALLVINEAQFTDAVFNSKIVPYTGHGYALDEVKGIPEDTQIMYGEIRSSNVNASYAAGPLAHTDAGSYSAYAVIYKPGYEVKILTATLTITPSDFPGQLYYKPVTAAYDGNDHINDVQVTGLPKDASISKRTVKNETGDTVTQAINSGVYTYSTQITFKNYNPLTITSSLTIRDYMPVYVDASDTIYFSNGKDHRSLYSLASDGTFNLIDTVSPKNFKKGTSDMFFNAHAGLMDSIKGIDASSHKSTFVATDGDIVDFAQYTNNIYYYSKQSINSEDNGIYKVDLSQSDEDDIVTRVYEHEADNLYIYNDDLYFINVEDSTVWKMATATTALTPIINDEKVNEFVISGPTLYCSVNDEINHKIGYVSLAAVNDGITVLVDNKAGEFLHVKNNRVYFNYTPTYGASSTDECGVWSYKLDDSTQKHILTSTSVNGFDIDESYNVIYTDRNNPQALYRFNPTAMPTPTTEDLLANFVKPENTTPIKEEGKNVFYNGKLYYLNMYADKTLWSYDETTKVNTQLSSGTVNEFIISSGGQIFINQPTTPGNNDIYHGNVSETSEVTKINNADLRDLLADTKHSAYLYGNLYESGSVTGIARMKTDGTVFNKFSNVTTATNLVFRIVNAEPKYFMYIDAGVVKYLNPGDIHDDSTGLVGETFDTGGALDHVKQFYPESGRDNDYHFIHDGGDGNFIKYYARSSRTSYIEMGETTTIKAYEMSYDGSYYYYYSYTSATEFGFYRKRFNAEESTYEKLTTDEYYGSSFAWSGSRLYFLNYRSEIAAAQTNADAHIYCLDVNQKTVTRIDN